MDILSALFTTAAVSPQIIIVVVWMLSSTDIISLSNTYYSEYIWINIHRGNEGTNAPTVTSFVRHSKLGSILLTWSFILLINMVSPWVVMGTMGQGCVSSPNSWGRIHPLSACTSGISYLRTPRISHLTFVFRLLVFKTSIWNYLGPCVVPFDTVFICITYND